MAHTKRERMAKAVKLYQDFTGQKADQVDKLKLPKVDVAVLVGEVEVIAYNTVRDGKKERYLHTFKASARPLLATAHDGKTLLILEGDFTFTERGITDHE